MSHVISPWWGNPYPLSEGAAQAAQQHNNNLTKPLGALGQLEALVLTLAKQQHTAKPSVDHAWISIFAADHGVVAEGVSAYPQAVTRQMVQNFVSGGAAISVLASVYQANLEIIDCGMVQSEPLLSKVIHQPIAAGTENFLQGAAMNASQLESALLIGRQAVKRAKKAQAKLFIAGEMGIGNSTCASALALGELALPVEKLVGAGTGLNSQAISHKAWVVQQAVTRASNESFVVLDNAVLNRLAQLGGFEVAAMVGAYLACAELGITALVDGFIASVAALYATRLQPQARDWMVFAHQSAEVGHLAILEALAATPLLQLGMRLGEGSGAGVALGLMRTACALHSQMATFDQAAVAQQGRLCS